MTKVEVRYGSKDGEVAWVAELDEVGRNYFYSESDKTITITKKQYEMVQKNPYAYYFSTALRLHQRCQLDPNFDFTFLTFDEIKTCTEEIEKCKSIENKRIFEASLYRAFVRHAAANPDDPDLVEKAELVLKCEYDRWIL